MSRTALLVLLLALVAAAFVSAVEVDMEMQAAMEAHAAESMEFFESRRAEMEAEAEAEAEETGEKTPSGTLGLDYCTLASTSVHQCFYKEGHRFVIPRAGRSTGALDTTFIGNLKNAAAAGFKYRDGYIFPKVVGMAADPQIAAIKNALTTNKQSIGMLWLDYETHAWNTDKAKNEKFAIELLQAALKYGFKVGVYTNAVMWNALFTKGFKLPAVYPLWYARYDGKADYKDWKPFANWVDPAAKQFKGDVKVCNFGVDINVY